MKTALIATVYNEAATIEKWIRALKQQTAKPDEFVIVDAQSRDGTADLIRQGFDGKTFPAPRIIVERCNIARGRNLAIQNATADLIVATDAGSGPDKHWFGEIVKPFATNPDVAVVGGPCPLAESKNEFQRKTERYWVAPPIPEGADCSPSSRNIAFTRASWKAVGGYPEWLTLTAEDALFNFNLHQAGFRFYHQPTAIVEWDARPDLRGFLKMMYGYGWGSAECDQGNHLYRNWILTTLIPPLILLSLHPLKLAPFRYLRNAAAASGWVRGKISGKKPPPGWKRVPEGWISPEAQAYLVARQAGARLKPSDVAT